jgi:hypothetical protein
MTRKIDLADVEALWTVEQVAEYLTRSPRWVYGRLKIDPQRHGSIPHVRLPGGAPRFIPCEIRAWVRANCPAAARFRSRSKE